MGFYRGTGDPGYGSLSEYTPRPHRGCMLTKTAVHDTFFSGVPSDVPWEVANYDTDAISDLGGSNATRLTVPANVAKIKIIASISWEANTSGIRQAAILKNGDGLYPGVGNSISWPDLTTGEAYNYAQTGVINVIPGDYFTIEVEQSSGGGLDVLANDSTWVTMQIIEELE